MKREYWIILIVYIAMQLSSLIGIPGTMFLFGYLGLNQGLVVPYWLIFSFTIALIIILFLLRSEMKKPGLNARGSSSVFLLLGLYLVFSLLYLPKPLLLILNGLLELKWVQKTHSKF